MKLSNLFLGIILFCVSAWSQIECLEYFKNPDQQQSLVAFTEDFKNLPQIYDPKELAQKTQNQVASTLQVIRPYLTGQTEHSLFIIQYISHKVANTLDTVHILTKSHGLIDVQNTASGLLSQQVQLLQTSLDQMDLLSNSNSGWFSSWRKKSKMRSLIAQALETKDLIPFVKEKVSQEMFLYAPKLSEVRNAEILLLTEISYLDEILKRVSSLPQSEAYFLDVTTSLMSKILFLRIQKALLESLILNYETIMNLGRAETETADLLLDVAFKASYIRNKSIYDKIAEKKKEAAESTPIDRALKNIGELSTDRSLFELLYKYLESHFLNAEEAIFILKTIQLPSKENFQWKDNNFHGPSHRTFKIMEELGVGSYNIQYIRSKIRDQQVDPFVRMDQTVAAFTLHRLMSKVSIDQMKEIKNLSTAIVEPYKNSSDPDSLLFYENYISMIDRLLLRRQ